MFKAVHQLTGEEIISLDARWVSDVAALRTLDRQDLLVCQECKQPLRLRAGNQKRWHFAHKHKINCTYGQESPALLQARAALYARLVAAFGDRVTLEKKLEGVELPRSIDCWVEREQGSLAYWIIDGGIRRDQRDALRHKLRSTSAKVNWIFVAALLHADEDIANTIHLSLLQREFQQLSAYNVLYGGRTKVPSTIHFLDGNTGTLTTYRALRLKHPPQLFAGHRHQHPLSEALVAPKTGELVHPGEREQWHAYREEQTRLRQEQQERKALVEKERHEREEVWRQQHRELMQRKQTFLSEIWEEQKNTFSTFSTQISPQLPLSPPPSQKSKPTCIFCGEQTDDWYFKDNKGFCRCNACLRSGKVV
jgi:hypothetical protein